MTSKAVRFISNTKRKQQKPTEKSYAKKLDAEIGGKNSEAPPSKEVGKQKLDEAKKADQKYFAFGSDDIVQQSRSNKKGIEETLQSGKDLFQKFGSFIGSSVNSIIEPKSATKIKKNDNGFLKKEANNNETVSEPNKLEFGDENNSQLKDEKNVTVKDDVKANLSKLGRGLLSFGVF